MENRKTLLDGKVLIISLPVYSPPFEASTEEPKRLLLEKGELAQIYSSEEPIHFIAYLEFIEGVPRGWHFHIKRLEYAYIIRGELRYYVKDIGTNVIEETIIKDGDFLIVHPGIAHSFMPIKSGHAIEFSSSLFDPDDTVAHTF
jgi:quercetin dioxygenase-like cupin family protein